MFVRERFYFYKLYFLLLRNKISLQYIESLNRTFFFRPISFSVVLRSNQGFKGIVSVYQTLIAPQIVQPEWATKHLIHSFAKTDHRSEERRVSPSI